MAILRTITRSLLAFDVSHIRTGLWKGWNVRREYTGPEDRHELLRALGALIGGSPRRSLLSGYAANGLFDEHAEVRRAAALLSSSSTEGAVKTLREMALIRETDPEVRELLH